MRKLLLLLLTNCCILAASWSQQIDFENFTTLKSVGKIPEDFTTLASTKFKQDAAEIASENGREKADKEIFLLESNFLINEMLHSGRVIFGDPVTTYLNNIKAEILKANPELDDDIRIYTLLSNDVNAFTADNGIVLVTTGLVAQAQNEAEIAFILCHEFSHFYKKHAIDNYVENRKIERGIGVYSSLDNDAVDLEKFKYSKDLETEADVVGLSYYKKTKYSLNAAENVFDVLLYSYLPFNEITFPREYFNEGPYVLPGKLFLDTLASITAAEDYDDETSTHPNIKKRKTAITDGIGNFGNYERIDYLQDVADFNYVQKICRFQGCEMYLYDIEYENAIYQAFLLQQEDSSNLYLKNVIAQSLYGMSMYKNASASQEWHRYYKKVEGESQQLFYMGYKLNAKELNILALKYAWELYQTDSTNTALYKICVQLGDELVNENKIKTSEFLDAKATADYINKFQEQDSMSSLREVVTTDKPKTKYDKIKQEKAVPEENVEYWKFAFNKYIEDKAFLALLEEDVVINKKSKRKKSDGEYHLGLDEVVVVDPVYYSINEKLENPILYQDAEQAKIALKDKLKSNADELSLKLKYLDYHDLEANDTELFNDLSILNRWMNEKISHLGEEVFMHTSTNDEFLALSNKYNIDDFAWMGIVSFTEEEKYLVAKIALCIYFPIAPFLIADLVTPNRNTFFFTLVANAETGKLTMQYYNNTLQNDSHAVQMSNLYYILQQIKSKK